MLTCVLRFLVSVSGVVKGVVDMLSSLELYGRNCRYPKHSLGYSFDHLPVELKLYLFLIALGMRMAHLTTFVCTRIMFPTPSKYWDLCFLFWQTTYFWGFLAEKLLVFFMKGMVLLVTWLLVLGSFTISREFPAIVDLLFLLINIRFIGRVFIFDYSALWFLTVGTLSRARQGKYLSWECLR